MCVNFHLNNVSCHTSSATPLVEFIPDSNDSWLAATFPLTEHVVGSLVQMDHRYSLQAIPLFEFADRQSVPDVDASDDVPHEETVTASANIGPEIADIVEAGICDKPCENERLGETRFFVASCHNSKGKRVWDKKHYCKFCGIPFAKLPRHFAQMHSDEVDVSHFLACDVKSTKRKLLIRKLVNDGDYNHNFKVFQDKRGELIPCRRPSASCTGSVVPNDFVPCEMCFGMFMKSDLWKHRKKCSLRPCDAENGNSVRRRHMQSSNALLLPICDEASKGLKHSILHTMNNDDVSDVVRSDRLIARFGSRLFMKNGHLTHRHQYISQRMRELGRLVLGLADTVGKVRVNLADYIHPSKFESIVNAIYLVCGFNHETHSFRNPSLPLKLGHSLKLCAEIVQAEAIIGDNQRRRAEAGDFIELCTRLWKWKISTHAISDLRQKKFNKPQLLPLTADIAKLHKFLVNAAQENAACLIASIGVAEADTTGETKADVGAWSALAQIALCQTVIFNRRRGGETERIKLSQFELCAKTVPDEVILSSLSPIERQLCASTWRLEIPGKRGRKVPVMFTEEMKATIDLLVSSRAAAKIPSSNTFLFARSSAMSCIRSNVCLHKLSRLCKADHPELITTTRLRKHIATVSQILNLKGNELDMLASYLGHNINIHRDYYRLPLDTLEVAKVSRILLAMEKGSTHFHGKSLEEIDININGK